jgi:3-methyladenine DNA glycosylase AlkD
MPARMQPHLTEILTRINNTENIIPRHRAAFKKGFSFSKDTFERQLSIWNHVWCQSDNFRVRLHAYFFLEQHIKVPGLHSVVWHTSAAWQNDVSDWPLCDALAKINTKVLETMPAQVYEQLATWNKDADLWKRRQSVVSLLYYSRTKKVFLPFRKITALVEPLLTDKEYYVQKGVGWTLREMHNIYPAETLLFFQKHIKNIRPIAFTIAIEKLPLNEKDMLKASRR